MNRRLVRRLAIRLLVCLLLVASAGSVGSQQDRRTVYVAAIRGVINPFSASYLSRAAAIAEREKAEALVVTLDTPGGLASSMQTMIKTILNSRVPIIVYVSPLGARAASAGMYITISAHVAAMAPATHIGAATPVSMSGGEDSTMRAKLIEDAAATARSLATERHRNAKWPEEAVRKSVSISAEEAMKLKVVDFIAPDLQSALRQADGRKVHTVRGVVILRTRGARTVELPMGFVERLLHVITDPNIAYLLLLVGIIGIASEFYHPGVFFPGVIGVISLALAFVAFDALPVGGVGVGLILVAIGLMVAEFHTHGFGALGMGAVVAFVLGSLLLYVPLTPVSPTLPAVRTSPWLVALASALFALFFIFVVGKLLQARRRPVVTGMEALVGKRGKAATTLSPRGNVIVDMETWSAESLEGPIPKGADVEVVGVSGVVLQVRVVGL
ncbi:MAG: nodulation protein NfeD [Armatimonadota bacterium]|nr:nodulation protein NfeD [Armatimonadota bacterium]